MTESVAYVFIFLLALIVVSHLLIIRRGRIMDDRVKEMVAHQRDVESWMESPSGRRRGPDQVIASTWGRASFPLGPGAINS